MNLWVGALALGLAFAASALGVFLTFRVLAFPDLTVDGSFPLGAAVSVCILINTVALLSLAERLEKRWAFK